MKFLEIYLHLYNLLRSKDIIPAVWILVSVQNLLILKLLILCKLTMNLKSHQRKDRDREIGNAKNCNGRESNLCLAGGGNGKIWAGSEAVSQESPNSTQCRPPGLIRVSARPIDKGQINLLSHKSIRGLAIQPNKCSHNSYVGCQWSWIT